MDLPVGCSLILAVSSFEQGIFTKAKPFGRWTATFRINLCDYEKESVETPGFNALFWCRWWDSNPHGGLAQRILSPSRLPIPSHRHVWGIISYLRGGGNTQVGGFCEAAARLCRVIPLSPSASKACGIEHRPGTPAGRWESAPSMPSPRTGQRARRRGSAPGAGRTGTG